MQRELSAEKRLILLPYLLEMLDASGCQIFFQQMEQIPQREIFPLRQLALGARFYHRFYVHLEPEQQETLAQYLHACYEALGQHFITFAKELDKALRAKDRPGVTEDWSAYERKFVRGYEKELDEKQPPGWRGKLLSPKGVAESTS